MKRWWGVPLILVLAPLAARAQAPEALLPSNIQVYLRWDGVAAHQAAYDKTALGKMLQGDTGKFFTSTFGTLKDQLGALLTAEQLLQGVAPEKLQRLQKDSAEIPKLLSLFSEHGFLFAASVSGQLPPQIDAYLILPDAGAKATPLFATIRLVAALTRQEVKETKVEGRTVSSLTDPSASLSWWTEGKHAVLAMSTRPPEAVVKGMAANQTASLTTNPLFTKVAGFKGFPTAARGFVDMAALAKYSASLVPDAEKLIAELGLAQMKSLTFYSGFDGDMERGLIEIDMPGARTGLMKLIAGKPFTLADVPPLPTDVVTWSMTHLDLASTYDVGVTAVERIMKIVEPKSIDEFQAGLKQVDDVLGIKVRDDLLASLGTRMLIYTSPAEGPVNLGQTLLLEVKDAKKLQQSLDLAIRGMSKASGVDVTTKKRMYRGVELRELTIHQEGFPFVPTYCIHNNWLVVGVYPQTVQGYLLRATKELPSWQAEPRTKEALDRLPKEFIAISYTDPRPSVKQILSWAPMLGGIFNAAQKDVRLEIGALPNAHEATRHLFPNVSVVVDDGKSIRLESRASLDLPFDLSGMDGTMLLFLGAFASRSF